jgi:hypothetical protein
VPGNHDVDGFGVGYYELYVGDSGVWDTDSALVSGHNGLVANSGWSGLRILGFNNSNGAWNQISAADLAIIDSKVNAAAAADENVLLGHHPTTARASPRSRACSRIRRSSATATATAALRAPTAVSPASRIRTWDLNTNSIVDDGDLYESSRTDRVYV